MGAIVAGADGYLIKKTPPVKQHESITEEMETEAPMTPTVKLQVLLLLNNNNQQINKNDFNLTKRKKGILPFIVQGLSH